MGQKLRKRQIKRPINEEEIFSHEKIDQAIARCRAGLIFGGSHSANTEQLRPGSANDKRLDARCRDTCDQSHLG